MVIVSNRKNLIISSIALIHNDNDMMKKNYEPIVEKFQYYQFGQDYGLSIEERTEPSIRCSKN